MHSTDLEAWVAATGELATLPATVVSLLDVLRDDTACADRVRQVIERDPALTANILKHANSAFYGSRREIGNVRDALVMLGNRSVASLAFLGGMAPVLRRDLLGYGLGRDDFWEHSLLTAAAASLASDRLTGGDLRCEAFTAGLVHDLGKLVLDGVLVAEGVCLRAEGSAAADLARERAALGCDHAEAGALLAEHWGFPATLSVPIAGHHDVAGAADRDGLTRAVAAGDLLAHLAAAGPGPAPPQAQLAALARLGLAPDAVAQLCVDLRGDLEETLAAATRPAPARA